jgi:hypothetical protein
LTIKNFLGFKAGDKKQALALRDAEAGKIEKFTSSDIDEIMETNSQATIIHFLNN